MDMCNPNTGHLGTHDPLTVVVTNLFNSCNMHTGEHAHTKACASMHLHTHTHRERERERLREGGGVVRGGRGRHPT